MKAIGSQSAAPQIEYDIARELGKKIYLFLATEDCETDGPPTQSEEEKKLQLVHRRTIENSGDIYYRFVNREDLARRVRELELPARNAEAPRQAVNLPYNSLGGPLFKGRDSALVKLMRRLMGGEGKAVGLTARQAIHGLCGVGKTRLAVEYAWRHASDYKDALLFVSARSLVDLRGGSFVPFTIIGGRSTNKPMKSNLFKKELVAK
jgi:hypothetical protein